MNVTPSDEMRSSLFRLCRGSTDAVELIEAAWLLAGVYDDAVDGEKKRTDEEIHKAFEFAMFGLDGNPVFRMNPGLHLALRTAVACWRAANALERTGDLESLHSAYVLRCSPYNFFVSVVLAVAGVEAAVEAATFFYGLPTDDPLDAYVAEHLRKD